MGRVGISILLLYAIGAIAWLALADGRAAPTLHELKVELREVDPATPIDELPEEVDMSGPGRPPDFDHVTLDFRRTPWELVDFRPGRATIEFETNQCTVGIEHVQVVGSRIRVYHVHAVDPEPRDGFGFGCTDVGGECGGPCERRTVEVTARRRSLLRGEGTIDRRPVVQDVRPQPAPKLTLSVEAPGDGFRYYVGERVRASFSCTWSDSRDTSPAGSACEGSVPLGDPVRMDRVGSYRFRVRATRDGKRTERTVRYDVVRPTTTAPGTGSSAATFGLPTTPGDMTKGMRLYSLDRSSRVRQLSGRLPTNATWSPGGRRAIYARTNDPDSALMLDDPFDARRPRRLHDIRGTHEFAPTWSADGQRVAFVASESQHRGDRSLYLANADRPGMTRLLGASDVDGQAIAPDGRTVAVTVGEGETSTRTTSLAIVGTDGRLRWVSRGRPHEHPNHRVMVSLGAWDPTGRYLAFSRSTNDRGDLLVYDTRTGSQRTLRKGARLGGILWSPDGTMIATGIPGAGIPPHGVERSHVGIIDARTGEVRRLTSGPVQDVAYAWSGDSSAIAVMRARFVGTSLDTPMEVRIIRPDGSLVARSPAHRTGALTTPFWQ